MELVRPFPPHSEYCKVCNFTSSYSSAELFAEYMASHGSRSSFAPVFDPPKQGKMPLTIPGLAKAYKDVGFSGCFSDVIKQNLSEADIQLRQRKTTAQSQSSVWKQQRTVAITSSGVARDFSTRGQSQFLHPLLAAS